MSKDKDAFKKAMAVLHEAALDDDQREALAVVERYSGELRRQAAALKAEVARLQGLLAAAEEKIAGLQKVAQEVAPLEERLRAAGHRVEMLEAQVLALHSQLPEAIPETTGTRQAVHMLTTHSLRVMSDTLNGWRIEKANEIAFHFGVLTMLTVCQYMTQQNDTDRHLEEELVMACHKFFHRIAPGQFSRKA